MDVLMLRVSETESSSYAKGNRTNETPNNKETRGLVEGTRRKSELLVMTEREEEAMVTARLSI